MVAFYSLEPFVILCKIVQTSYALARNPKFVTIYVKATDKHSTLIPVVPFTFILYKVALPFESVDEIRKCNQSNEFN